MRTRLMTVLLVTGLLGLVGIQAAAQEGQCFDDANGDTTDFRTQTASDEPRADILEHCANFGPTLSLNVEPATATDPETDEAWQDATGVFWFLDVDGDDEGEFLVDLSLDADGELRAQVFDIRGQDHTLTCEVSATATAERYHVSNITPGCLDDHSSVRSSPWLLYDTDPDSEGGEHSDTAPGAGGFEVSEPGGADRPTGRNAGDDRFATSVAISQDQFPDPAAVDVVYLAREDLVVDAVAGGVLTGGPILLVPRCADVPQAILDEINRLNPDAVIALGGTDAICATVLSEAAQGRATARHAGDTRFTTPVAISQAQFPDPATVDEVYLARGTQPFADAVAGGVLTRGPILLVPSCGTVRQEVIDEVDRLDPDTVFALGGTDAICDSTHLQAADGRPRDRIAGATRFTTSTAISQHEFPDRAGEVFLARATEPFVDAVSGGVLTNGPILLVPSCGNLPVVIGSEISRVAPDRVTALGGTVAICNPMLQQAAGA